MLSAARESGCTPARGFHVYFFLVHLGLFAGWLFVLAAQLYADSSDLIRDSGMGFFIVLFLFMNLGSSAARCRSNISNKMRAFHLKVSGALQHLLVLASMVDLCIQMHVFFMDNQWPCPTSHSAIST